MGEEKRMESRSDFLKYRFEEKIGSDWVYDHR